MKITSSCTLGNKNNDSTYSLNLFELTKEQHTALLTLAKKIASGKIPDAALQFMFQPITIGPGNNQIPDSLIPVVSQELPKGLFQFAEKNNSSNQDTEKFIMSYEDFQNFINNDTETEKKEMGKVVKMTPSIKSNKPTPPMYRGKVTLKHKLLEHVKSIGGTIRYTDAIKFVLKENRGIELRPDESLGDERGYFSSGFSYTSAYFTKPGRDGRYLQKNYDGLYELAGPKIDY